MENKKNESNQKDSKEVDNISIFSKEKINTGHQNEVDYLKTLGVFLMVTSHVYDSYSVGYPNDIIEFLSFILGAAGFMFLMGLSTHYSRHQSPKSYIARALGLITIGQLFNIFRDTLPNLIAWWVTGRQPFIARAMQVIQADILSFAGIAFIFLAIAKILKISNNIILIISFIMNIAAYPLFKIMKSPKNFLLSQLLGYFVLTDAESFFPFCSYFIFVAAGYWIGDHYQRIANKDKLSNLILIIFVPIVTLYYIIRSHFDIPFLPEYFSDEHYSLYPGPDAVITCMANIIGLAFFHKIDILLKGKTPEFVTHAGKNLNQYYIISYLFISQMEAFMIAYKGDHYPKEMKMPTLYAIMLLILCRIMIDFNDKYIHFTISTLKNPMRNIVFSLIWIASIILVIYIYPKIEVYATFWNNYLRPLK